MTWELVGQIVAIWIALNAAYVGLRAIVTRKRQPSVSDAGRTLRKLSEAEAKRRRDEKTAQLRLELGR